MAIHIGKEIEKVADSLNLKQGQVGERLGINQQKVSKHYSRTKMYVEEILEYSAALDHNFLSAYYELEPLKTFRKRELAAILNTPEPLEIEAYKELLKSKEEIIATQNELIATQKNLIEELKKK